MGHRRLRRLWVSSSVALIASDRGPGTVVQRTVAGPCVSWPAVTDAQGNARNESSARPASAEPSVIALASPAWMAMKAPVDASPRIPMERTRIATRTSGRVKARLMGAQRRGVLSANHHPHNAARIISAQERLTHGKSRGFRACALRRALAPTKSLCRDLVPTSLLSFHQRRREKQLR